MAAAVLFRGHAYRSPNDGFSCRSWGTDWRLCIDSHRRFLLDPLRERYGAVDVFACFYRTPFDDAVLAAYRPRYSEYAQGGASQRQTFLRGVNAIVDVQKGVGPYDLVATCRFDIELLSAPTLHPGFDPSKVNFLFREWNVESWRDHRRVCDVAHFLPGELLDGFRVGVVETPSEHCLHMVYLPVERQVGPDRMNVILGETIHDSNTEKDDKNPFFRLVRVR